MRGIVWFFILCNLLSNAQAWQVLNHPNNGKKAIIHNGKQVCDYVFTEVSELAKNKAYVAQGELFAYIDTTCKEFTPYIFAEANNFTDGFAIVGDSFNLGIINKKMQVAAPLQFAQVRLPKLGLIIGQTHTGTWGALDTLGKIRLPFIYDLPPQIIDLEHIIVRSNDLYGVVNDCNEIIFNTAYQFISSQGLGYRSGKYLRLF